jgi:hypothetical protein
MNKLQKIDKQEQITREKIAAMQAMLKEIDGQRTEQENLQIIQKIRAFKIPREELYAFFESGVLPASIVGAISGAGTQETIYSRRGATSRDMPDGAEDTGGDTDDTDDTDEDTDISGDESDNFESEDMSDDTN